MELAEDMLRGDEGTTKLSLGADDIFMIAGIEQRVSRVFGKFKYSDITKETLTSVMYECTVVAKQFLAGHLFFNHDDNCFYELKYMKATVNNIDQSITVTPYFVKNGGITFVSSKK